MLTEILIPLLSLVALEVVLGIDNIIFISILSERLPEKSRKSLRFWGLGLAMVFRLGLLYAISWIMKLNEGLFTFMERDITGKDMVLILGGLFLLYKSTKEIYHKTEAKEESTDKSGQLQQSFGRLLLEVVLLDMVFSIDSIITAVGMVKELWIMYASVIITVLIMLAASGPINNFILKHPSFKILALSFLMMIGVALIAEGFSVEIPKGYIYFSMGFAFLVDLLQMRYAKNN